MAGDLVIWHMDAGSNPGGRLSGLFDYATITAAWLALTWPLLLGCLLRSPQGWRQRGSVLVLVVLHGLCLWLTASRNAWATAVLALPLVLGPGAWAWLLPLLLVAVLPVALAACRSWCALRFPIPSGNVSRIRHLIVLWPPRA